MSYLYLIIPPVIIVISLSILLILISRRSQKILAEKERGEGGLTEDGQKLGVLKNGASSFNRFFLRILEKIAHNFKIFSLKIHNLIERWLRSIKEKKERVKEKTIITENREEKIIKDGNAPTYRNAEVRPASKMMSFSRFGKRKDVPSEVIMDEIKKEKKSVREIPVQIDERKRRGPMVSRSAVYPEVIKKVERKDELEEILIERIASDPRDVEAYERLGDYYYDRRNTKDAVDCYKQVLKLSPVNRAVKVKLRRAERGLRGL